MIFKLKLILNLSMGLGELAEAILKFFSNQVCFSQHCQRLLQVDSGREGNVMPITSGFFLGNPT